MAIPDYQTFMLPVLRLFAEGASSVSECLPRLKAEFEISDQEAEEMLPSGRVTVLASRVHWARTYLSKAGLLESPRRNRHVITRRGQELLARNPARIDIDALEESEAFREWRQRPQDSGAEKPQETPSVRESVLTPEDAMENAQATLDAALRDDLLGLLYEVPPERFEVIIINLLSAMGFGGGNASRGLTTRKTGDGGVDGIMHEDALGLDAVYIQAKRYAPHVKVGRPDIQQFVGTLTGESATKGVFVTTSDFSSEAKAYIQRVQHRIVLINGQRLAQLMIDYDVGVRSRRVYHLKSIDEDFFVDLK